MARRDDTPAAKAPIRGTPARQDEQRWTPSLIAVGALVFVALIVALVLYVAVSRGEEPGDLPDVTRVPADGAAASADDAGVAGAATDSPPVEPIDPAAVRIATVQAWDPDGDNGTENDSQAQLALADGSSSTMWATECYQDRFMGGKRGVGLIFGLNGAAAGTIAAESLNGPYQIDVFTATGESPPADLDAWSQQGPTLFDDQPGSVEVSFADPANYVLVWLKELGPDEACTSDNPFRGRLGEISFRP